MRTLGNRVVAILEGRQSDELAGMVTRCGGIPLSAPSVRERPSGEDAAPVLDRLVEGVFSFVIVLTGAGATALFAEAERRGMLPQVLDAMHRTTIVSRGPKPLAALKRHGLYADIVTQRPHTTRELLEALETEALDTRTGLLLHYGERNTAVAEALTARGARIEDVCLYEWALPENVEPIRDVVRRTVAGEVDAMLFTSQIQFRFLLQVADETSDRAAVITALNEQVVVGAVGPVCAAALRAEGVTPDVLPAVPNSASLVGAVADYFDLTRLEEAETRS